MSRVLTQSFFNRPTLTVSKELLGKYLVRRYRGKNIAHLITEVEAYDGFCDKASHAHRGETKRNAVMFGPAGYWYVYLVYGMHLMLNIVTDSEKYPAAVLIRGVEEINGPARVTKALHVTKTLNDKKSTKSSGLWIEDRGVVVKKSQIKRSARVGVDYAGEWAKKQYRFVLKKF